MEEFKIKGKRLSKKEKAELLALNLKWCGCCKKAMSIDLFTNIKYKLCRACSTQKGYDWKNKNPEKAKEQQIAWRAANSEQQKEYKRKKYEENPELARQKWREWHNKNKDQVGRRRRERYYANHEKSREWYNLWERNAYKNNPLFALSQRIRKRTRRSFILKKIPKTKKSREMLGCTWEELKIHIESQFTEGMSWERIREIHIDHIIPLASATTEEELIKLAHYTNLQPLWALDNISKGARLNWEKDSDSD